MDNVQQTLQKAAQPHLPDIPRSDSLLADRIETVVRRCAQVICWATLLLIAVPLIGRVLYYHSTVTITALPELQWQLYAVIVLSGLSYALTEDAHLRIDVLHHPLSIRSRAMVELVGLIVLLLPFASLMFYYSLFYTPEAGRTVARAYLATRSGYGGLIRVIVPLSFALLLLATVARIIRQWSVLHRRA